MKMFYKQYILSIVILLIVGVALAGAAYEVVCANKGCGFKETVRFGGSKRFDMITGYCAACEEFVYITWDRREQAPEPMGQVWDSASGKTLSVYACPNCDESFLSIPSILDLKHCPQCGQAALEHKLKAVID